MDSLTRKRFESAILVLGQNDFQNFINVLFNKRYKDDFQSIKQKQDGGSDGILGNSILAVYGPTPEVKTKIKEFKNKFTDDHNSYKLNWKSKYPNWIAVYNDEILKSRFDILEKIHPKCKKIGVIKILEIIEELKFFERRDIAEYLGISLEFINNNLFMQVVEDMMKVKVKISKVPETKAKDIEEKIRKNYDAKDVDNTLKELDICYSGMLAYQNNILRILEPTEISALELRVYSIFNNLNDKLSFKEKMIMLIDRFSEGHEKDDIYVHNVSSVIFYYFNKCIIGEAP